MKILMVSETLPARQLGGLAKHAVTLANTLLDAGHEVALLGLRGVDDEASLRETGFKGRVIGGLSVMPGWKEGPLGCFNPLKRPFFARRMAREICAHAGGFDVVHYHGNNPLVAAFVPREVNFVQTRHDQGSECLVHVRYRADGVCRETSPAACAGCAHAQPNVVQRQVSSLAVTAYRTVAARALGAHKTIFVSEAIRHNAGRVLPRQAFERSIVIHNFIDQPRLAAHRPVTSRDPASPTAPVLIASRLDDAKGVGLFLDAWQARRPAGVPLALVGDGPRRMEWQARHQDPDIRFLGHQPYETTLAMTAACRAAVVPSQCEEACSTTILEALFLGVPCLALRRGGNPELAVYQQWPGQLMLFDSVEALVEGLVGLLAAPPSAPPSAQAGAHAAPAALVQDHGAAASSDVRAQLPRILQVYEA